MKNLGKIRWGYVHPWYKTVNKTISNKHEKFYGYVLKNDNLHPFSEGQLFEFLNSSNKEYITCVRTNDKLTQLFHCKSFANNFCSTRVFF